MQHLCGPSLRLAAAGERNPRGKVPGGAQVLACLFVLFLSFQLSAGGLDWFDDTYNVQVSETSNYFCNNSGCIKYACTSKPKQPFCKECAKIVGDVYSDLPVSCDTDCKTCSASCKDFATDWHNVLPVPGAYGDGYSFVESHVESHVCTSGTSMGQACPGPCTASGIGSWHTNCSQGSDSSGCSCAPGNFVCVGESPDEYLTCDPLKCDPSRSTFSADACECKTGACQFIPGIVVSRSMATPIKNTRCQYYNMFPQTSSGVASAPTLDCGSPRCIIERTFDACPKCTAMKTEVCNQVCLLDPGCVGTTWEPPKGNASGNCYKSTGSCVQQPSAIASCALKEVDWQFPKECLPRLELLEDQYKDPRVGFTHDDGDCQKDTVTVLVNVKVGQVNFGVRDGAYTCEDPNYNYLKAGNPPRDGECQKFVTGFMGTFKENCASWPTDLIGRGCRGLDLGKVVKGAAGAMVSFLKTYDRRSQVTFPGVKIQGPYAAVRAALRNMTYVPPGDQNSIRLRSRIYSVQSSRALAWPLTKPYEEMTLTVLFSNPKCGPSQKSFPWVQRFIVHILDANDPPFMKNLNKFSRPAYCDASADVEDCIYNAFPLSDSQCYDCHFGPFYAFEGSGESQSVTGTQLEDTDLLEDCTYETKSCAMLDAKVAVLRGQILLGSQGGVELYKSTTTAQAFISPLSPAVVALATVLYIAAPVGSTNPSFNTQTLSPLGGVTSKETVSFLVSDQGFKGVALRSNAQGQLILSYGVALSASLDLPMTVVAVNQPPTISSPSLLDAIEDVQFSIQGLTVDDPDADDVVVSTLANYLWMKDIEFQDLLNKVQLTLSVQHGRLYFPFLKDMVVLSATDATYLLLTSRYPFHDLCRMKTVYLAPSSYSYDALCTKQIIAATCPTGTEQACVCMNADTCSATANQYTALFLNNSLPAFPGYLAALQGAVATTDLTCGGVPYYKSPVFTVGHVCSGDLDCQVLTSCSQAPGGCLCCANLNVSCTSNRDCWGADGEEGSLCGCTWNGPASTRKTNPGTCGPWLKPPIAPISRTASALGDLIVACVDQQLYQTFPCGINTQVFYTTERPLECPACVGQPCTYSGVGFETCLPPVLLSNGTGITQVTAPLETTGAKSIKFYGALRGVNTVLSSMTYNTDPYYNRLYRIPQCYPPPLDISAACAAASDGNFQAEVDSTEVLTVEVNDLGNSGGTARSIQIASRSININVGAVNNAPLFTAPTEIQAVEGLPFSFLNPDLLPEAGFSLPAEPFYAAFVAAQCEFATNVPNPKYDPSLGLACLCYRVCLPPQRQFHEISCSCSTDDCNVNCALKTLARLKQATQKDVADKLKAAPRQYGPSIFITDPDYLDYGFMVKAFDLNISCQHGKIILNEAFLQQRDLVGTRIKVISYSGYGVASDTAQPENNVGVGLYYIPSTTAELADCAYCDEGWEWKGGKVQCCSQGNGGTLQCRTCPRWGVGNRFISLRGTMEDLNLALSNITYVGDKYFNTRYNIPEQIKLVVNDNGAIGEVFNPLGAERVIDVGIESVNDPPSIGHLIPVLANQVLDPSTLVTVNLYTYAMTSINQSSHYVVVDEDTPFVFNHTWIWIDDVDSIEAVTIGSQFATTALAARQRTYSCTAGGDSAGLLAIENKGAPVCKANDAKTGYVCQGGIRDGCSCFSTADFTTCSGLCLCSSDPVEGCCSCSKPLVCPATVNGPPVVPPGTMLLQLYVSNGLLSFYPPPGRSFLDIEFFRNTTSIEDSRNYSRLERCSNQYECMQNRTAIIVRGTLRLLQTALRQKFLSYIGKPNFVGQDRLSIWLSDQGFTDVSYKDIKTVQAYIRIEILPVNDAPVITIPPAATAIQYVSGVACNVNFMKPLPNASNPNQRNGLNCPFPASSKFPPSGLPPITVGDVDVDDVPWGNVSLTIQIQAPGAGQIYIDATEGGTLPDVTYWQHVDEDHYNNLFLWGKLSKINHLLRHVHFDSYSGFSGYMPMIIRVSDFGNYGGAHCNVPPSTQCRNFIFDCPIVNCPLDPLVPKPDLCVAVGDIDCLDWLLSPNMPHLLYPNQVGLTTERVDAVVKLEVPCDVSDQLPKDQCTACQKLPGCRWCLGFCKDSPNPGRCMVGGALGPKYETCPSGYGVCSMDSQFTLSQGAIIGLVIVGAIAAAVALTAAIHIRKIRQGGLIPALKQWGISARVTANKLKIFPPKEARWMESGLLLLLIVIASVLYGSGFVAPPPGAYTFTQTYIIDSRASSMTVIIDGCQVRYVPAARLPSPYNSIRQVLVRAALPSDPLLTLSADMCTNLPKLELINNRNQTVRYKDFFCNIEIAVPDNLLLPETNVIECILEECTRPSMVRGGPMDQDSRNFGLDFGPNGLHITGTTISARLQNMSAKSLTFQTLFGKITALDIRVATGTIETQNSDIVLSTDKMTSVFFLQGSGNLVCLTAANNSLFVDNNCRPSCGYLDVSTSRRSNRRSTGSNELSSGNMGSRRVLNLTRPAFGANERCPDGTLKNEYPLPPQVYVPGCIDFTQCTMLESDLCLCRPACEMVEPENLCFGNPTICGFAGTCNIQGQCCRDICVGRAQADLFPTPDQPRNGAAIDPVNKPWSKGKLEQQWTITSAKGQISVSSLATPVTPSESQYLADAPPAIREEDRPIISKFFHPDGAQGPPVVFFEFRLGGPGVPELQDGEFIWVSDIRYMVVPSYVLDAFSLGLLNPSTAVVSAVLLPSFCPASTFNDSTKAARLIQIQRSLLDVLETETSKGLQYLPKGSYLLFSNFTGVRPTTLFFRDPQTGVVFSQILEPNDFRMVWVALYMALVFPASAAVVTAIVLIWTRHKNIVAFRDRVQAEMEDNPNLFIKSKNRTATELLIINKKVWRKSSFYDILEYLNPLPNKTFTTRWFELMQTITFLFSLVIPLLIFAAYWQVSYINWLCQYRPDRGTCMSQVDPISTAVGVWVIVYISISLLEYLCHFLQLQKNMGLLVLRVLHYAGMMISFVASCCITAVVLLWVLGGALLAPARIAPYSIAVAGFIVNALTLYSKMSLLQSRVRLAVKRWVRFNEKQLKEVLPPKDRDSLDRLADQCTDRGLHRAGLSLIKIIYAVALRLGLLMVLMTTLLVGFASFTQVSDPVAGSVNIGLQLLCIIGFNNAFREDAEDHNTMARASEIHKNITQSLIEALVIRVSQMKLALEVLQRMDAHPRQGDVRADNSDDEEEEVWGAAMDDAQDESESEDDSDSDGSGGGDRPAPPRRTGEGKGAAAQGQAVAGRMGPDGRREVVAVEDEAEDDTVALLPR